MAEVQILEAQDSEQALGRSTEFVPRAVGRSAGKRVKNISDLVKRLRRETQRDRDGRVVGPLRPCTVVNFNPIALVIGGQIRITVPAPGASEHHQIKLDWRGRRVQGHYMLLASPVINDGGLYSTRVERTNLKPDFQPVFYSTVTGHETDEQSGTDMPVHVARFFSPHAIGCEITSMYNSAETPMGGILLFDQDQHTLSGTRMAESEGRVWVPERALIDASSDFSYTLRETTLEDELDRIFNAQRQYCDVVLQRAHSYHTSGNEAQKQMVTDTHREWDRYAVKMGWKEKLSEFTTAKMTVTSEILELVSCAYCGTQQPNRSVFFCKGCNAPYDTFKAFMHGLVVPPQYLELLEGEDLQLVRQELAKRKRKFAPDFTFDAAANPNPYAHAEENPASPSTGIYRDEPTPHAAPKRDRSKNNKPKAEPEAEPEAADAEGEKAGE